MTITDVRIRKIAAEGKMKAIVSITFDNEFVVHDIKVIEGQNGLFIAMPSRKTPDGEFKDMGLEVVIPKGAFYVFPSIKKFNIPAEEFALRLLHEEKVACVPGTAFGIGGEGYLRISYCYSDEELIEALKRIEKFIEKL